MDIDFLKITLFLDGHGALYGREGWGEGEK